MRSCTGRVRWERKREYWVADQSFLSGAVSLGCWRVVEVDIVRNGGSERLIVIDDGKRST